jgi:hypothetical protein
MEGVPALRLHQGAAALLGSRRGGGFSLVYLCILLLGDGGLVGCVPGLAVRKLDRFFEEVEHGTQRLELR